jgi:RHS repeat-associated protein
VLTQTITAPGLPAPLIQTYFYDGVNRLDLASESPGSWSRAYGYDPYGNRAVTGFTGHTLPMATPTTTTAFSASTNRINAGAYDPAGNLLSLSNLGVMGYDANNKMTSFDNGDPALQEQGTYAYDGAGQRVQRTTAVEGSSETTTYVYDAFGKLAAEYATTLDPNLEAGTFYRTVDHLGSTRVISDQSGAVVERSDFFPFGEKIPADAGNGNRHLVTDGSPTTTYNQPQGIHQKFTGKERDEESGLDYFKARYHSSSMGRFASPDPISYNLLRVISPQRWNRYAYAVNNPLQFVDPDGRDAISVNFSQPAVGMGHQGIMVVRQDGIATFGDFGPVNSGVPIGSGKFTVEKLATRVAFDSLGLPTEESLQGIVNEVSVLKGDDSATISLAYFKTTGAETQSLSAYLDTALRRQISGDVPAYFVGVIDCSAFCFQGLRAAGVVDGPLHSTMPNIFQFLVAQAANANFSGKTGKREVRNKGSREEITSTLITCDSGDDCIVPTP